MINFTPVAREDFLLGVDVAGTYEEVFNSDREEFGGSGVINVGDLTTTGQPWNSAEDSVKLRVPPLGMLILQRKKQTSKQEKRTK